MGPIQCLSLTQTPYAHSYMTIVLRNADISGQKCVVELGIGFAIKIR